MGSVKARVSAMVRVQAADGVEHLVKVRLWARARARARVRVRVRARVQVHGVDDVDDAIGVLVRVRVRARVRVGVRVGARVSGRLRLLRAVVHRVLVRVPM